LWRRVIFSYFFGDSLATAGYGIKCSLVEEVVGAEEVEEGTEEEEEEEEEEVHKFKILHPDFSS